MILDIVNNGFSIDTLISLMSRVFVVFCVLPIHEFAHAFIATKLGDDTARLKGRLTLSPLAHIDIMGAVMIFLVGFGYAKPVPVNPRKFKNPKAGMAITALAGPFSNLLMALVFLFLHRLFSVFYAANSDALVLYVSAMFFFYAATVNVGLAVFNFLPIPPLDGSRILNLLIPAKYYFKVMQYERYIVLAVFALIIFNVLDKPLNAIASFVMSALQWVVNLPFDLILR